MLLPYYIASMNIEHAYMERTNQYATFEGICLVDTFDLAEPQKMQLEFMTEGNTERILKQKKSPIRVVIGNPPYNMGQVDESDQNKNRKYRHLDKRVQETYTADSKATLRNKLSDPYVKAFRLASDRVRATGGIVAYVTNNSFIDQIAFDGMRANLARDFSRIFVIDLGGNVRQNPKLSGTTHNVFGIQVGVAITILVKDLEPIARSKRSIFYARMPETWRRGQKTDQLETWSTASAVKWKKLVPDSANVWLTDGHQPDFTLQMPLIERNVLPGKTHHSVFEVFSLGIVSSRDAYVFNYHRDAVEKSMRLCVETYNEELDRYKRQKPPRPPVESFTDQKDPRIKWSHLTKVQLERLDDIGFESTALTSALYRPFCRQSFYFSRFWNERRYQLPRIFPDIGGTQNKVICVSQNPLPQRFHALATNKIPDFHLTGDSQSFPFYAFDEGGTRRRENITDWALDQYRTHYRDKTITKWDIFHSTYAVLHHPEYRTRYAANLKRELPRIPFPPDLHAFAAAGKRLMELHIDYEKQAEYPLEEIEHPGKLWTLRVEKMSFSKDKTELRYNEALTLRGIPAATFEYRLGNRSALEWVVDQYRVSTDPRSGIVNDPNREDDPDYILRLIKQVITVSLETQEIVGELPSLKFGA